MKHILYTTFLFCILLIAPSLIISSCVCCLLGFQEKEHTTEVTHYISEVLKIRKGSELAFNPLNTYYLYPVSLSHMGSIIKQKNQWEYIEGDEYWKFPYTDKNNETKYIKTSLSNRSEIYTRDFSSNFLFFFFPLNVDRLAIYNNHKNTIHLEDPPPKSYHYISTDSPKNGYNLEGFYVKSQNDIPSFEKFFQSVKDTFNLIKISYFGVGPAGPINTVLIDTIKAINIYCNTDYNDKYKKGELLNDIMKIVYFDHIPFLQKWHQAAIDNQDSVITSENETTNLLFSITNPDNYIEEWLNTFNAKANTQRLLLHPEILLLCTENPATQWEYSFTLELVYNNGKKIIKQTPPFPLLKYSY